MRTPRERLVGLLVSSSFLFVCSASAYVCDDPPIDEKGWEPGRTVSYSFEGTWDSAEKAAVVEAIDAWNVANAGTGM